MIKLNRPPYEKPYPSRVWLMRPLKTALILTGIVAGFLWVIGSLIDHTFPPAAVKVIAAVCVVSLLIYYMIAVVTTHRQERFARTCLKERKAKIAEFEALGFRPSRKFIGSSRMFAVDEAMGKWYLIDYFNHPGQAKLRNISSIVEVSREWNCQWVPYGHKVLLPTGKMLSKEENEFYFSRVGVLLKLDEQDDPAIFINCFKTENDVDLIIDCVQSLLRNSSLEDAV